MKDSRFFACRIGGRRVGIPLDGLERLLEYGASPAPPLARPWIGGLFLHSGRTVLSLTLTERRPPGPRKGLLLRSTTHVVAPFALEVEATLGIVQREARPDPVPLPSDWCCPDGWLRETVGETGSELPWIDVDAVARSLAEGAR